MVSSRSRLRFPFALAAVIVTALLLAIYAALFGRQMSALRTHGDTMEQARLDGVQLLRIQADLNQIAALMRDLVSDDERSIAASASQFDRVHKELGDAVTNHTALTTSPDDQTILATPVSQFWAEADRMLALARNGHETEARTLLRLSVQRRHAGLATTAAFMLLDNNEQQGQEAQQLQDAGAQLRRQAIWLIGASLVTLALAAILIARVRSPRAPVASASEGQSHAPQVS